MAKALKQRSAVARAVIDLSANENPLGPSPKVAAAIQAEVASLHRYPSRDGTKLRNLLANQLLIETEHLLLGNGASELLDVAARTLLDTEDEALIPVPSFMPYQKVVARAGATAVTVPMSPGPTDLEALLLAVTERTRVILLGNPNNPTGSVVHEAALQAFMDQLPARVVVIIDEAYVEYVSDAAYPDTLRMLQHGFKGGAQLLVLRSLSKAWGLAGLRIGYAIGPAALIADLNACCQFYNTNALAQTAACAALQDLDHLRRTQQLNRQGIDYFTQALSELGVHVWPSQANFVLVDLGERDGDQVIRQLAQRGVLVKSMSRFGLPHCLRVSTGLMQDNHAFIEALTPILTSRSGQRPARAVSC